MVGFNMTGWATATEVFRTGVRPPKISQAATRSLWDQPWSRGPGLGFRGQEMDQCGTKWPKAFEATGQSALD